jgi:hypothetical protein
MKLAAGYMAKGYVELNLPIIYAGAVGHLACYKPLSRSFRNKRS